MCVSYVHIHAHSSTQAPPPKPTAACDSDSKASKKKAKKEYIPEPEPTYDDVCAYLLLLLLLLCCCIAVLILNNLVKMPLSLSSSAINGYVIITCHQTRNPFSQVYTGDGCAADDVASIGIALEASLQTCDLQDDALSTLQQLTACMVCFIISIFLYCAKS